MQMGLYSTNSSPGTSRQQVVSRAISPNFQTTTPSPQSSSHHRSPTSSIAQLQAELREWYVEKSRTEHRSAAYAQKLREAKRRSEEERLDAELEERCRQGRSQVRQNYRKCMEQAMAKVEANAIERRRQSEEKNKSNSEAYVKAALTDLLQGFRRHEPTPELTLDDVLCGSFSAQLDIEQGGELEQYHLGAEPYDAGATNASFGVQLQQHGTPPPQPAHASSAAENLALKNPTHPASSSTANGPASVSNLIQPNEPLQLLRQQQQGVGSFSSTSSFVPNQQSVEQVGATKPNESSFFERAPNTPVKPTPASFPTLVTPSPRTGQAASGRQLGSEETPTSSTPLNLGDNPANSGSQSVALPAVSLPLASRSAPSFSFFAKPPTGQSPNSIKSSGALGTGPSNLTPSQAAGAAAHSPVPAFSFQLPSFAKPAAPGSSSLFSSQPQSGISAPPATSPPAFSFQMPSRTTVGGDNIPAGGMEKAQQSVSMAQRNRGVIMPSLDDLFNESARQLASTTLGGWINYYTDYYARLSKEVEKFEADTKQKAIRQRIRKSIVDRINFVTKKRSTNQELAKALAFFLDLLEGKSVQVESAAVDAEEALSLNSLARTSATLQLEPEKNPQHVRYAMWLICTRFIQQVKWDPELITSAMTVIVSICLKHSEFYKLLNAVCFNESTFMKMSGKEVLNKLLTLISAPSEAATNWIASETGVFQLFCRTQTRFQSRHDFRLDAKQPQNIQGPELLRMFLLTTLEVPTPVLMASAFVVAELLGNTHIAKIENNFATVLHNTLLPRAQAIVDFNWEPLLQGVTAQLRHDGGDSGDGGKSESLLRSRHGSLICLLQNAIQQASEMK